MPKALNLVGQVFGRLTVIEKSPIKKSNRLTWHCLCSCGNETDVITNHLTSNHTTSCGCLQREKAKQINPSIDLTNQKFGKLTAIKRASNRRSHTYWECLCECGNYCEIRTNSLRTGHTISCGCVTSKGEEAISQWLIANNIPFERQKQFESCKNPNTNYSLKFDFFIDERILVEYDGINHFRPTQGWNYPDAVVDTQYRDNIKNEWAKQNNIPLYRISYNEIYNPQALDNILTTIIYNKGDK